MFVSDKLIYLQLQKAASTHITKLLSNTIGGSQGKKHSSLIFKPHEMFILGSIRNPWDWYVSLWAHGCRGGGNLHRRLKTGSHLGYRFRSFSIKNPVKSLKHFFLGIYSSFFRPKDEWRRCYADSGDPLLFRRWLKMILSPKRKYDLCEKYAESSICSNVGFMTYRYLRIFTIDKKWLYKSRKQHSFDEIIDHDNKSNVVNRFIKCENLEKDFITALFEAGYDIDSKIEKEIFNLSRTNISRHKPIEVYYDNETVQLVDKRDKFIIQKHGYSPPVL